MESNNQLVDFLKDRGYIETGKVEGAFRAVDRANYVPENSRQHSYMDRPLQIGENATISAPHMVAINTELLEVEEDSKVLEVGSGSGYQLAILAELSEEVTGVEISQELAEKSSKSLKDWENAEIVHGDGIEPVEGKFDRILYSAAIDEKEWMKAKEYLEEYGILVAPVKQKRGQIIKKLMSGEVTEHSRVRFVEKV